MIKPEYIFYLLMVLIGLILGKDNIIENLELMTRSEHARHHTVIRWENGNFI